MIKLYGGTSQHPEEFVDENYGYLTKLDGNPTKPKQPFWVDSRILPTRPEPNMVHLKIALEKEIPVEIPIIFRGELLVLGSVWSIKS